MAHTCVWPENGCLINYNVKEHSYSYAEISLKFQVRETVIIPGKHPGKHPLMFATLPPC